MFTAIVKQVVFQILIPSPFKVHEGLRVWRKHHCIHHLVILTLFCFLGARMFVGGSSSYCAKNAPCPVVIIRRDPSETPSDPLDDQNMKQVRCFLMPTSVAVLLKCSIVFLPRITQLHDMTSDHPVNSNRQIVVHSLV